MKQHLSEDITLALDGMLASWDHSLNPLTTQFLNDAITSVEYLEAVGATYEKALATFDAALSAELGIGFTTPTEVADNSDGRPDQSEALRLYPVSITGHNLMRLLQVLVSDTNRGLASTGSLDERLLDLEVTVEQIGNLLIAATTSEGERNA